MEDRINKDIGGIVDNINEMNKLVENATLESIMDTTGCFPEVYEEWYPIILKVVSDVNLACTALEFDKDEVVYYQVKEKWNNLVIHCNLKQWAEGAERDEYIERRLDELYDKVSNIIQNAEEEVKKLVQLNKEEPKC